MTVNRSDEDPVFAARPRNVQHYRAAREPDSFAPGVTDAQRDALEAFVLMLECFDCGAAAGQPCKPGCVDS